MAGDPGETLVIAAELRMSARHRPDAPAIAAALAAALGAEHDLSLGELLLAPGALPRTTSGELRRAAVRQAHASGRLPRLASWRRAGMRDAPPAATPLGWLTQRLEREVEVPVALLDLNRPLTELGLDSLARLEVLSAAEARWGIALPANAFEGALSPRALAGLLADGPTPATAPGPALPARAEERPLPLSPRHQEFLARNPDETAYGTVLYLRTAPGLDATALARSFAALDQVHDALRLRFTRQDGHWRQTLAPPGVGAPDFGSVAATDRSAEATRALSRSVYRELVSDIDLVRGPLVRGRLVERGGGEPGLLMLFVHHFVADAASLLRLLGTLSGGYESGADGVPPASGSSYALWLETLQRFADAPAARADLDHWRAVLGPPVSGVGLRSPSPTVHFTRCELDPAPSRALLAAAPRPEDQEALFLAAAVRAWCSVSGERECVVSREHHGRHAIEGHVPSTTVGWLASDFPLRVAVAGLEDAALVEECLARMLATPSAGTSYGALRWMTGDEAVRADLAARPAPAMGFRFRGRLDEALRTHGPLQLLNAVSHSGSSCRRAHDLELYAGRRRDRFWFTLAADGETHSEAGITTMATALRQFLEGFDRDVVQGAEPASEQAIPREPAPGEAGHDGSAGPRVLRAERRASP